MVSNEEITRVLLEYDTGPAVDELLRMALANGGKDNVTIILCRVKRKRGGLFGLFERD